MLESTPLDAPRQQRSSPFQGKLAEIERTQSERESSFDTLASQATQDERIGPLALSSPQRGRIEGRKSVLQPGSPRRRLHRELGVKEPTPIAVLAGRPSFHACKPSSQATMSRHQAACRDLPTTIRRLRRAHGGRLDASSRLLDDPRNSLAASSCLLDDPRNRLAKSSRPLDEQRN